MSDLVERVARVMCASVEARTSDVNVVKTLGYDSVEAFIDAAWPNYAHEARAAIAVLRPVLRAEALEEAAKVADWPYPASAGWNEEQAGRIAAANDIRALKDNL